MPFIRKESVGIDKYNAYAGWEGEFLQAHLRKTEKQAAYDRKNPTGGRANQSVTDHHVRDCFFENTQDERFQGLEIPDQGALISMFCASIEANLITDEGVRPEIGDVIVFNRDGANECHYTVRDTFNEDGVDALLSCICESTPVQPRPVVPPGEDGDYNNDFNSDFLI